MSYNITQDPIYKDALDRETENYYNHIGKRRNWINSLEYMNPENVVSEFTKVIPIWLKKGNELHHIDQFLQTLGENGKLDLASQCGEIYFQLLSKEKENWLKLLPSYRDRRVYYPHCEGYSPSPDANFDLINTFLAFKPIQALKTPELLSKSWIKNAVKPENRDAAYLALISAICVSKDTFLHNSRCRLELYPESKYVDQHMTTALFHRGFNQFDFTFDEFLLKLESAEENKKSLSYRYMKKHSTGYGSFGIELMKWTVSSLESDRILFNVLIKAGYFRHMVSKKPLKGIGADSHNGIIYNLLTSRHATEQDIVRYALPGKIDQAMIGSMHEHGYLKAFLNTITRFERKELIDRLHLPAQVLDKSADRADALAHELGI